MQAALSDSPTDAVQEPTGRMVARLARQVELALSASGLSVAQYRALAILGDGGRAAASELAELMAVSRPTVTGVVDGLAARGLVCRQSVDGDRRRVDVVVTDAGRAVISAADGEVESRLDDFRASFGTGAGAATDPGSVQA